MVATGSDLCALRALVHNVQPEHCKFRSDLCSAILRRTACIIMIIIESVEIYGENPLRESTKNFISLIGDLLLWMSVCHLGRFGRSLKPNLVAFRFAARSTSEHRFHAWQRLKLPMSVLGLSTVGRNASFKRQNKFG